MIYINRFSQALTWRMALAGILFLLVIRPATGILAMAGTRFSGKQKWRIGFLGIRGIGSFFYLAYGLKQAGFAYEKEVWAGVAFIVLISIIIHGFSAVFLVEGIKNEKLLPEKKRDSR